MDDDITRRYGGAHSGETDALRKRIEEEHDEKVEYLTPRERRARERILKKIMRTPRANGPKARHITKPRKRL